MKVIFNTYPTAFQCPGGGEIQLRKSMQALQKRDVETIEFNPWKTVLSETDIVHYFSVQGGSMNFCNYVHNQGIPLVLSPIIWLGDTPEIYPVAEINALLDIADVICPNSNAEASQLSEYFNIPPEKFYVTHNGIDKIFTEHIDGQLFKHEYNIDSPFILCVGNIEPRKNQLNLIKAVNKLGLTLVLIGNIRDQEYYNQCMSISTDKIKYIGTLEHHSPLLRSAYNACDLFALPSTLETPGLAALEAAAAGSKILITKTGCTEEYFTSNALYTDDDPSSIEKNILLALSSDTIPDATFARDLFWDNTAGELINAYQMAINKYPKT